MSETKLSNNWDLVLSGMLRCIYQVPFLEKYHSFITPKYFYEGDTDTRVVAMRKMFDVILDIYKTRRHKELLGSLDAFEIELKKSLSDGEVLHEALTLLKRFYPETGDPKIIRMATNEQCESQFLDYLKMAKIRDWTGKFSEPWRSNKMHEAQILVDQLSNELKQLNKREFQQMDTDKIPEFLMKMNNHGLDNFRIGIPKLDNGHGWIEPKTLNLFAAPPGRGKSMMANSIIRLAIKQGKYIHVTIVENREENFIPRIVASLTGIQINDLKHGYDNLSSEQKIWIYKASELVKKYVTVTFMYGQGVEAVHAHKIEMANLRKFENLPPFQVDLLDYTGHVVHYSGNNNDPMHTRFRNAYAMRKDFALKQNLICFDFVQINREGTKKNDGGGKMGMGDMATSFDLTQVCDTLLTINQSDWNREANEASLYVAKGREGGLGEEITVRTDFARGRFDLNYDSSNAGQWQPRQLVTVDIEDGELSKPKSPIDKTPSNVTPITKGIVP